MSDAEAPPSDEPGLPFLVAGVGGSAGGLEAYTELLEALPADPNLAVLVVSHLDPTQKSHLTELLGRVSKMTVREVTEGMKVEVNHVYVIPPGTTMVLADGRLTLSPRPPRTVPHMPIDHMLRSLAAVQKSRSAGVILSGNGSDGAIALQAIKAVGGVTFAQDEASARHPGMPRAAALDGSVDHVLPPREIARELARLARHPYAEGDDAGPDPSPAPTRDPVTDVLDLLRTRTGVDFAHYKQTTIRRRIMRRMALRGFQAPAEYLALLRTDAAEVQSLYQDFLIRVTQFFRDSEAFDALKEKVFPALLRGRAAAAPVRIWVAGCATGEEVYSLAMCLLEFLDGRADPVGVKILATDLNESALEKARAGVYLDNIEIDVSPERLRRFFVRTDGHYQISKAVRELCVFSRHNMATDPPFSRLDLVSCRNVLIYMDAALQKRVMPLVHYALNPHGFLFLGSSENVGGSGEMFDVVDARHRIFVRNSAVSVPLDFNANLSAEGRPRPSGREEGQPLWTALDVQKEADRVLLARYAPVGVVADEALTVLQFRGRTAAYLEPAPGMATLDLFRMLREGLLAEVRAATNQAKAENTVAAREGVQLTDGGGTRLVRIEVVPFKVPPSGARFFLVLFQDAAPADPAGGHRPEGDPAPAGDRRPARVPPVGHRGAGEHQRGVEERQRGDPVVQRGAAEHQRGAADGQGGGAVGQRGALDGERGVAAPERRTGAGEQRPGEPARRGRAADRDGRPRPAHPPVHAAGGEGVQPDPDRRRPADQRHQVEPAGGRLRGAGGPRDRHAGAVRGRGVGPGRAAALAPHPPVRDAGQQDRRRVRGARGRRRRRPPGPGRAVGPSPAEQAAHLGGEAAEARKRLGVDAARAEGEQVVRLVAAGRAGHEHDRHRRPESSEFGQGSRPVPRRGHLDVEEHQPDVGPVADGRHRLRAGAGGRHGAPGQPERHRQHLEHRGLVVHDQDGPAARRDRRRHLRPDLVAAAVRRLGEPSDERRRLVDGARGLVAPPRAVADGGGAEQFANLSGGHGAVPRLPQNDDCDLRLQNRIRTSVFMTGHSPNTRFSSYHHSLVAATTNSGPSAGRRFGTGATLWPPTRPPDTIERNGGASGAAAFGIRLPFAPRAVILCA
jgi:two-component system CheB/CheR fusion protein